MAEFNFEDITIEELRSSILATFQTNRPSADTTYGSDAWLLTEILTNLSFGMYINSSLMLKAIHPTTCIGRFLDAYATLLGLPNGLGGYGRIQLAGSSGEEALQLTGDATAYAPIGTILSDPAGRTYSTTESLDWSLLGAGTATTGLIALSTGVATNLEAGAVASTLTLESAPAGVSLPVLVVDLDGGTDLETDEELRTRVLAYYRSPSISGNYSQIRGMVEAVYPGQIRAYVWDQRWGYPYGAGTVDISFTQKDELGEDRAPTETQRTTVSGVLFSSDGLPLTTQKSSRVLSIVPVATTVDVEFELRPGAATSVILLSDWDALSLKASVYTYDEENKTIVANQALSSVATTGDRVFIGGEETKITSFASSSGIVVESWLWADDLTSYKIMSGGGLVSDVYSSLLDWSKTIGPERGTTSDVTDLLWEDTYRIKDIQEKAREGNTDNIMDVVVIAPAADVSPETSTGYTANMLVLDLSSLGVWEKKS